MVIGAVLLAHAYATRHLPADAVPSFLDSPDRLDLPGPPAAAGVLPRSRC